MLPVFMWWVSASLPLSLIVWNKRLGLDVRLDQYIILSLSTEEFIECMAQVPFLVFYWIANILIEYVLSCLLIALAT